MKKSVKIFFFHEIHEKYFHKIHENFVRENGFVLIFAKIPLITKIF